jgi:hypothetical protein
MVILLFRRLWKLQKISLREIQSTSIRFPTKVSVSSHNRLLIAMLRLKTSY